ncbi:hypothetical protein ES705_19594 [subsurface metagenome]
MVEHAVRRHANGLLFCQIMAAIQYPYRCRICCYPLLRKGSKFFTWFQGHLYRDRTECCSYGLGESGHGKNPQGNIPRTNLIWRPGNRISRHYFFFTPAGSRINDGICGIVFGFVRIVGYFSYRYLSVCNGYGREYCSGSVCSKTCRGCVRSEITIERSAMGF